MRLHSCYEVLNRYMAFTCNIRFSKHKRFHKQCTVLIHISASQYTLGSHPLYSFTDNARFSHHLWLHNRLLIPIVILASQNAFGSRYYWGFTSTSWFSRVIRFHILFSILKNAKALSHTEYGSHTEKKLFLHFIIWGMVGKITINRWMLLRGPFKFLISLPSCLSHFLMPVC